MHSPLDRRQLDHLTQMEAHARLEREEHLRMQVATLALLDALRGVPTEPLSRMASLCVLRAFAPETLILNEGVANQFLYLTLRGTLSLTLRDRVGRDVLVGVLNRGDCFGEGPLFGDLFRGVTVQTKTICYLLQIPLDPLRAIMAETPSLDAALRCIYRRHLVEGTLGRVPLFSQLSPLERARIAALLQPRHYPRGASIIEQGAPGDALYLIEAGQVVVERDGLVLAYMDEGNFFGEMSLLTDEPHNANIRAQTPVDLLALPAADLERLMSQQPALASQLVAVVERRRIAGVATQRDHAQAQQLAAMVARGVLRGTHLLVRDPQRCPDECRICEDACTQRHGHPRIHLGGVQINAVDVTDTCRQCRVGAECVEVCPEEAIQWNDHGALIITDRCSGCGGCIPACPYDAVHLVPTSPPRHDPLWGLWRRLKRTKALVIPLEHAQPRYRADKCDLCHGYDDLACVSACPTGALRLVPVEELFPL